MAKSETTRTDDETYLEPTDVALIGVPVVTAEFARQLERELHLKDQKIAKLIQERDEDVKQMEAGWLRVAVSGIEYYKGVAESLQSQLAAAQENERRYFWLKKNASIAFDYDKPSMYKKALTVDTLDAAIDAAQGDPS